MFKIEIHVHDDIVFLWFYRPIFGNIKFYIIYASTLTVCIAHCVLLLYLFLHTKIGFFFNEMVRYILHMKYFTKKDNEFLALK